MWEIITVQYWEFVRFHVGSKEDWMDTECEKDQIIEELRKRNIQCLEKEKFEDLRERLRRAIKEALVEKKTSLACWSKKKINPRNLRNLWNRRLH